MRSTTAATRRGSGSFFGVLPCLRVVSVSRSSGRGDGVWCPQTPSPRPNTHSLVASTSTPGLLPPPRHRRDTFASHRAQDQEYPGTAFTRSIGDSLAESLGVMAEPELDHHQIKPNDKVLIVASDGIFEFITTRGCLDMALLYNNPLEACLALVGESYKLWIEREDRTDDITIIVGFIEQSGSKRDHGVGVEEVAIEEGTAEMKKKKTRRGSLGGKAQ